MAKILSISEPEAGVRSIALDDGSTVPMIWNEGDPVPTIGSEWPPAPSAPGGEDELSAAINRANTLHDEVEKLKGDLRSSELECEQHVVDKNEMKATIESLQAKLGEMSQGVAADLRKAADFVEGKVHPSAPHVANLDDMPSLDKLQPAKTVEQLEIEKSSAA